MPKDKNNECQSDVVKNKENWNNTSNLIEKNREEIVKSLILSLNIEKTLENDLISKLKINPEFISKDSKFTKEFAKSLIDEHNWEVIIKNLDKFEDLDIEIAIGLMRIWYWKEVVENLDEFDIDEPTFRYWFEVKYIPAKILFV